MYRTYVHVYIHLSKHMSIYKHATASASIAMLRTVTKLQCLSANMSAQPLYGIKNICVASTKYNAAMMPERGAPFTRVSEYSRNELQVIALILKYLTMCLS